MSDVKKFMLIDSSNVSQIANLFSKNTFNSNQRLSSPVSREVLNLVKRMAHIANDANLSDDEKVDSYEKALNSFLDLRRYGVDSSSRPIQPTIQTPRKDHTIEQKIRKDVDIDKLLLAIPKTTKIKLGIYILTSKVFPSVSLKRAKLA